MALIKLHDDIYLASGNATKDAEFKRVGEKDTPLSKFSIAAGKRKDTTTIFIDIAAWRTLARYASNIRKGDSVCIIGKMEEREYNGKTYKTLTAEWLNFIGNLEGLASSVAQINKDLPHSTTSFTDLQDSDSSELPF